MATLVFERVEKKYLLNSQQFRELSEVLEGRFQIDKYGKTTINNIYYDTPDHLLIRRSLEKPVYKEKLRVRSYGKADRDTKVFIELKKKYKGVVYKRRTSMALKDSYPFLNCESKPCISEQIENEIQYFMGFYENIAPAMYIGYDRIAMYGVDNKDLRITFDTNIRYRQTDLRLDKGSYGEQLLENGQVLMEIKIPGVMPLWLSKELSRLKIFPTSFSKYGKAYTRVLTDNLEKGRVNHCA
ncbi:MAG: polyphosphate polymerase domain-containing protein [Ruminococcus sp.]|nr:polyphosphate polymerase domain-containing protein [Ruminococcus sp.]